MLSAVLFLPGCDEYQSLGRTNGIKYFRSFDLPVEVVVSRSRYERFYCVAGNMRENRSRPRRAVNTGP